MQQKKKWIYAILIKEVFPVLCYIMSQNKFQTSENKNEGPKYKQAIRIGPFKLMSSLSNVKH